MAAKHRRTRHHHDAYKWLGTGAITLGIGAAALVGGTGIAQAKGGDTGGAAGASKPSSADHTTTGVTNHKKTHSPAPTAGALTTAATANTPPPKPVSTPKTKQTNSTTPAPTAATPVAAAPTAVSKPVTPAAAAVTLKPVSAVTTTAKPVAATTATTTNPITTFITTVITNIQKALLGFQTMFFNTPPKITVTTPTKNADGTYTGQFVGTDADGDPLTYSAGVVTQWGTTTVDNVGNNTYTYTYTPSATIAATGGTVLVDIGVYETNYAAHFHGLAQIEQYLLDPLNTYLSRFTGNEGPLFAGSYYPFSWGAAYVNELITIPAPSA